MTGVPWLEASGVSVRAGPRARLDGAPAARGAHADPCNQRARPGGAGTTENDVTVPLSPGPCGTIVLR